MYAVFENGSHQYRVSEGEMVRLDYRDGAEAGQEVIFDHVLLVQSNEGTKIGRPYLTVSKVSGEIVEHQSDKITVWKFKRRKRYRRKKGHRQHYTSVKINQIVEKSRPGPSAAKPTDRCPWACVFPGHLS